MAKPYVRWLLGLGWLRRASRFCFFVSAQTQEHRVLLLLLGLCVWRERGGTDSTVAKWDFATGKPPASSRLL